MAMAACGFGGTGCPLMATRRSLARNPDVAKGDPSVMERQQTCPSTRSSRVIPSSSLALLVTSSSVFVDMCGIAASMLPPAMGTAAVSTSTSTAWASMASGGDGVPFAARRRCFTSKGRVSATSIRATTPPMASAGDGILHESKQLTRRATRYTRASNPRPPRGKKR